MYAMLANILNGFGVSSFFVLVCYIHNKSKIVCKLEAVKKAVLQSAWT